MPGSRIAALAAAALATAAAPPAPDWNARALDIYRHSIEVPTVAGRGKVPELAGYYAGLFRAAGFAPADIHVLPYEGAPGDRTAALIVRWPAAKPGAKPLLLLAHMDVVEAKREDWSTDPFAFVEKDGYY